MLLPPAPARLHDAAQQRDRPVPHDLPVGSGDAPGPHGRHDHEPLDHRLHIARAACSSPPPQLVFTTQPSNVTAQYRTISPSVQVTLQDHTGVTITSPSITVSISLAPHAPPPRPSSSSRRSPAT